MDFNYLCAMSTEIAPEQGGVMMVFGGLIWFCAALLALTGIIGVPLSIINLAIKSKRLRAVPAKDIQTRERILSERRHGWWLLISAVALIIAGILIAHAGGALFSSITVNRKWDFFFG